MARALSADLLKLLKGNDVCEHVQTYIKTSAIFEVKLFAAFITSEDDCQVHVNAAHASLKDNKSERARLSSAWADAIAIAARDRKRMMEDKPEEDLEAPLNDEEHNACLTEFEEYYHWTLSGSKMVTDSLLAKFRREFIAWKPNQFSAGRTKSLEYTSVCAEPKR